MDKVMAKEPEFHATADFGCYIHIYNRTSVDLSLYDSKAEYGFWAKGSPPNVIEPETEVTIHLKDKAGMCSYSSRDVLAHGQRAHFGDLQFLHGMASEYGENPNTTKARAMAWLEVMYKLAIGEGVTENDRLDQKFPSHFNSSSKPHGGSSLRDLFLGTTTAYNWPDIPRRALGSCLHVIQDSYAVGHTLRRLRNPEDLDSRDRNGYFLFKHGRYAQLGPIITFHTYSGQSGRHAHYDKSQQDRDPKDPNTFNHIIGARDSIEKSVKLMNYYESKTKWEDGVANFFTNEVLALDADATPSNADVDERFGIPETSGTRNSIRPADTRADQEWQAGLERKMALLEGGFKKTDSGNEAMPSTMRRARLALVPALKWLMVIFALILISVLTQFATRSILL